MNAAASAASSVFLNPGEYFVGGAGQQVNTILGSCVSITLWHRARKVGAMSHFVLLSRSGAQRDDLDARYGDEALMLMHNHLQRLGIAIADCEAKLFGGGDMFQRKSIGDVLDIGRHNGHGARLLLESHGIRAVAESLFGLGHRRIRFDIASGDVWAQQVTPPGGICLKPRR